MNLIDLLTLIMVSGTVVVLGVFGYWLWHKKLRIYKVCYFYVPSVISKSDRLRGLKGNCVMRYVGSKEIKNGQKFVEFKVKAGGQDYAGEFPIDWERPSDLTDRKTVFSFDIVNKLQIQYNAGNLPVECGDVELYHVNMTNAVLGKLFRDALGFDKYTLLIIILLLGVAGLCAVMGYALYPIFNPIVPVNGTVVG